MATLKENLIKEILEINDSRVLESIRNLIHSIDEESRFIRINNEQKDAFKEAKTEYEKGNFHSTDDLFNEFYNLEEQPYINEARLLGSLHSVWEVKLIIDLENDQSCLSKLLKITEVNNFYAITEKLKLITSFEDENFLCMLLQFMKLAKDILKNDILLEKIKIIKSQL